MNGEIFGFEINVWLDVAARVGLAVGVMTLTVLALIYLERKILARFQMRLGPTRTGPIGLMQPVADALKLIGKEDVRPRGADPWVFELAVYFVFVPVFLMFVAIPFALDFEIRVLELGVFYVVAIPSLSIVGSVMAGWGSDNRYAMLGALRSAAQAISYELPLIMSLLAVAMVADTLNLRTMVIEQGRVPNVVWQPLAFVIFYTAMLAELNRAPFDIAAGESEMAGGPHIEYSGMRWSMFFLAEYAALFLMALIGSAVFLGGWAWPLGEEVGRWWQLILTGAKVSLLIFSVFWVRATLPRLRIDQLMTFSWKVLLPLVFAQILVNGLVLVYEWPDLVLTVTSGAGVVLLFWLVDRAVRRPRPRPSIPALAVEGETAS